MTTPTLAARLAKIGERMENVFRPVSMDDVIWMYRILSRLGDEKVVEAAALTRCAMPDQVNVCETACAACVEEARAALSAAVTAAMEE